jgi:hypothetical protein
MGEVDCYIEYGVIENIEVEDLPEWYYFKEPLTAPFLF